MARLSRSEVEAMMEGRPGETLEAALGVFEVFASGALADEATNHVEPLRAGNQGFTWFVRAHFRLE